MIAEATQLRINHDAHHTSLYADSPLEGHTPKMRRMVQHAIGRHQARQQAAQRRTLPVYRFRVGAEDRVTVVKAGDGWRVHHTMTGMVLGADGVWTPWDGNPATPGIIWTDQVAAEEAAIVSILDA